MPIQIENGRVEIVAKETPPAIPKTYAELSTLVAGNLLVVGQDYLLTDFATHYQIPNTTDFHTGSFEHLILTAISTSTFCEDVCSQEFPKDKISYEFIDTSGFGGDKGRITYRNDTVKNIIAHEDWRNTFYRRWSLSATPTIFDQLTDVDLTGLFLDSPIFNLSKNISDVVIDSSSNYYSNTIFYDDCYDNIIGSDFNGDTFFGPFTRNKADNVFTNCLGYFSIDSSTFGHNTDSCIYGTIVGSIFGVNNQNVTFGDISYSKQGDNLSFQSVGNIGIAPVEFSQAFGQLTECFADRSIAIGPSSSTSYTRSTALGYTAICKAPRQTNITPTNTEIFQNLMTSVGTIFSYTTDTNPDVILNDWNDTSAFRFPNLPIGNNINSSFDLDPLSNNKALPGALKQGDILVGDSGNKYTITSPTTPDIDGNSTGWNVSPAPVNGETVVEIRYRDCLVIYKQTNRNNGFDASDDSQIRFKVEMNYDLGVGQIDRAIYLKENYKIVSGDTTLDNSYHLLEVNDLATITLPTAVGIIGKKYNIIRTGISNVTIQPQLGETISGDSNLILTNTWDSVVIYSNGVNWVRGS